MNGIGGYQQGLMYRDGIYNGLLVVAATGLNCRVEKGLAIVGGVRIENGASGATTDILLPNNATSYIYVNHPDAKDGAGADIATFGATPEADVSRVNINGSTGTMKGRSFVLARVVTSGGAITVVDNTARLALANIPPAMFSESLDP